MTRTSGSPPAAIEGSPLEPTAPGHRWGADGISVPVPGVGTFEMSRPELAYVGGIVALSVFGLLDWPLALVIAGGHLLAADRTSRVVRDFGQAMTRADADV